VCVFLRRLLLACTSTLIMLLNISPKILHKNYHLTLHLGPNMLHNVTQKMTSFLMNISTMEGLPKDDNHPNDHRGLELFNGNEVSPSLRSFCPTLPTEQVIHSHPTQGSFPCSDEDPLLWAIWTIEVLALMIPTCIIACLVLATVIWTRPSNAEENGNEPTEENNQSTTDKNESPTKLTE
jgi:hypothetical protein